MNLISDEIFKQEGWGAELAYSFGLTHPGLSSLELVYFFIFQKYVPQSLLVKGYV